MTTIPSDDGYKTIKEQDSLHIISMRRLGLDRCRQGNANYVQACRNLAFSLWNHYTELGGQQLLTEVIDLNHKILALCPLGHIDHALSCNNLAASLRLRYEHTGDQQLLKECIDLERTALTLCPLGHLDHARSCLNLAVSLHLRYEHTGDQQLLTECIDLGRSALALCPPGHLHHVLSCRNLAASLHHRYTHTENQGLLTECIDLERSALTLCPPGHPDHALSCRNLAASLHLLYEHIRNQKLLTESIDLKRRALALCPPGHPDHAKSCQTLASSLHLCHKHRCDTNFLKEATVLYQMSLVHCSPSTRWKSSIGLAVIYLDRETSIYGISQSIDLLAASLQSKCHDSIPSLVKSAVICLDDIWRCQQSNQLPRISLGLIYQRLAALLPILAHPVFGPQAQLEALKWCKDVGADACIDAVLCAKGPSGVEMLELMQGLVWSQILHRRDPQLSHVPAHLANELKSNLRAITRPELGSEFDQTDSALTVTDVRHNASVRAQAIIQNIRAIPGLDRFMLGESFASLCAVAFMYPAVVLVHARGHSYALIIAVKSHLEAQVEERCSLLRLDVTAQEIIDLNFGIPPALIRRQRGRKSAHDIEDLTEGRGPIVAPLFTTWIRQMKIIWDKIVCPVLNSLKVQASRGRFRARLYWCPTGIFSHIPLHAAGIYSGPRRIFCSDFVVSTYTPTLTSLLRAQRQTPAPPRGHVSLALVAEKFAREPGLSPIPKVDVEIEQVSVAAERAQVHVACRIIGSTQVDMVSTATQSANIVHLACHGIQDPNDATQSGFCLGDGRLTIGRLMDLSIANPFLAFLSACETAKGDAKQPDQVMHLAAAMLFCGFKGVIATVWAICDDDGPKVAKWFYEELFANEVINVDSVAYALDTAVGKLRDSGVPPDRWAPFIHMGA